MALEKLICENFLLDTLVKISFSSNHGGPWEGIRSGENREKMARQVALGRLLR
jgi:hypothetical protein